MIHKIEINKKTNKMNKHFLTILSVLILLTVFAGCEEEFLEQPPENTITTGSFWVDDQDIEEATNSIYNALQRPMASMAPVIYGDVWADDMVCPDPEWFIDLDNFTVKSTSIKFLNGDANTLSTWSCYYAAIFRANVVLEHVDDVKEASEKIIRRSVAEAKFLRAYAYFMLVNIWKDVPFYLENLSAAEAYDVKLTNSDTILNQVERDLLFAAGLDENLNEVGEQGLFQKGTYEMGRATKGAAMAMLARVYLYRQKWDNAKKMAQKVMDIGIYELEEDYGANWDNLDENGKESIFELQFKANQQFQNQSWQMNVGNWIHSFTSTPPFDPSGNAGWSIIIPAEHVPGLHTNGDLRRKINVFVQGDIYPYAPEGKQDYFPNGVTGTNMAKYIIRNHFNQPEQPNYGDSDLNMLLIRYAEVLLIYAEASYELGETAVAFDYLNKIRNRAGLDALSSSDIDFKEALIEERRIEFFGEGHRFFDLRRWEMDMEILGKLGYGEEDRYLPYPQQELDINPDLIN